MPDPTSQQRRILSLWFPRLGADWYMRKHPQLSGRALAIVDTSGNAQTISTLSVEAQTAGVHVGQPMRDAHAMCEGLMTRNRSLLGEKHFLMILRRWAGKFSPWVAEEGPQGLSLIHI